MKKLSKILISTFLVLAMMLGFVGCSGEEVTVESKEVNGITLNVPSGFNEFEERNGMMVSTNEDATASIVISAVKDAQGIKSSDFDKETYQSTQMKSYKNVEFLEFSTEKTLGEVPALYVHAKGTSNKDVNAEVYNYMLFYSDGTFQSIVLSYAFDHDSYFKSNIDSIISSIKTSVK